MLVKNPNYNPNDQNSQRWINQTTTTTPSVGSMFKGFTDPFKELFNKPATQNKNTVTPVISSTPGKTPNMSIAPPNNMSVAPTEKAVTPPAGTGGGTGGGTPAPVSKADASVLALQKALNAKGAGLAEDGIMGPKTQAAVQQFGTGAGGVATGANEIDYNALAKQAGAAGLSMQEYLGLIETGATPGTKEYDAIYKDLGIPDLVSEVYKKPTKSTQSIYEDYYNQSGLADIKNKVAELDTELKGIRDGYTEAKKAHQDNPWLSAETRSAKIAREKELYGQKEANAIALRQSYLDQYDLGVGEIEKTVGRVAGDLEFDRTLSADKLNYLLNEAERKAGLAVTDKTKENLRYTGTYLKSRKDEKIAEETRAFNRQVDLEKLKSSGDISNAIANLSQSNPTAGGYFNALNNILAIKDSTPAKSKIALNTLTGYLQDGDTAQAREYLQQLALGSLGGTDRSDAMKRTQSINATNAIIDKINAYAEKYGDTNILTGTFQNIQQSLGTAGNADAVALNKELTTLLQQARVDVTGAAWGKQEDAEYKKINASISNTRKLNLAILNDNLEILNRNNASSIEWAIGKDTYNQLYRPTTGTVKSLPVYYAGADADTQAIIDEMVADGLPEETILQVLE